MEKNMSNETTRARAAVKAGAVTLKQRLAKDMKDPEFARAYRALDLEADVAGQVRAMREQRHLTQQQLAERVHMKREAIVRIERGHQNFTLGTIGNLAKALGCRVELSLVPAKGGSLADRAIRRTRLP